MEKKILAKVGDKEISNIDIDNAIQGLDPYQAQQFQTEEGRKYVLEDLVNQELLYMYAKDNKIDEDEAFKKEMAEIEKNVLKQYVINQILTSVKLTDEEKQAFYEANKTNFSNPETKVDKVTGFISPETTTSSIKLAWNKVDCDGYEITRYSTASKKYVKIADINNADTTTYTDSGRTSGCYYKYKIRAYKVVDGVKVYSEESNIVKATAKPQAPELKAGNIDSDSISMSWNAIGRASGYEVYRKDANSEDYKLVKDLNATTYTDKGLAKGTEYSYKVKSYRVVDGVKVYSEDSNSISAKIKDSFKLNLEKTTRNSVEFSWDKIKDATGYEILRYSTASKKYVVISDIDFDKLSDEDREASEEAEVYSYLDQGRTSATIYKYQVKAYNKVDGKKVYLKESEKLKATTTPLTPNVTVKSSSKKTARLSWTNCSTRATGYKVYMATSKNGTYKLVKTTTAKSFTKYYLTSGKTYYFKVRAYRTVDGKNIYGNYSTIKSIRVK